MKSPAAYYLLLLYCTLMMRCALPVACDALSHIFNEEGHIATVHAVYGSHHLQAEVAGTAASDASSSKHTNAQQDEPTVVHTYTPGYDDARACISISSFPFPSYSSPLCSASLLLVSQPPESC